MFRKTMTTNGYFGPGLFRFLKDLKLHNEREWFLANQQRYENDVLGPFLRLIADLAPGLKKISPNFVADPSPNRGSLMRIYRDIRFSKDKSPYKTHAAAHFWHAKDKDGVAPAYFLHLEPGNSVIGGGIWQPEPKAIKKIRDKIAVDPKAWGPNDHGWCPWLNLPHGRRIAEAAASRLRPGSPVHRRHQAQGLRHQHSADKSGNHRR